MKKLIIINLVACYFIVSASAVQAFDCVWSKHDACSDLGGTEWTTRDDQNCQSVPKPSGAQCCCQQGDIGCCKVTAKNSNTPMYLNVGGLACQQNNNWANYIYYTKAKFKNNSCDGNLNSYENVAIPFTYLPDNTNSMNSDSNSSSNSAPEEPAFSPLNYQAQTLIPVPGSGFDVTSAPVGSYDQKTGKMTSDLLARYIKAIYTYGQMIAGILAAIILMGGGLLWLTSAGNDSKIAQAKELITGSVIGLVILFGSWIILNTINPDLLQLKVLQTQVLSVVTLRPEDTWANTLKAGITQDNPLVCCQLKKNGALISCKDTAKDKCMVDITQENSKTLSVSFPLGSCSNNAECISGKKNNLCDGKIRGQKCNDNNGYCYGPNPAELNCYPEDGNVGSPCSDIFDGATCQTSCSGDLSKISLTGGRDCGTGLSCCIIKGDKDDRCGVGEGVCEKYFGLWGIGKCYKGSHILEGRSCKSGLLCCSLF